MEILKVGDLRNRLSELPDDAIVAIPENEYGGYYAVRQVKLVNGFVVISERDEYDAPDSRVFMEQPSVGEAVADAH